MTPNPEDFTAMRERLAAYDAARDTIIKRSRDITKASKQAIYALHRDAREEAAQHLADAKTAINELLPAIRADPTLRTGGFSGGMEEYVEARLFLAFLEHGTLLPSSAIPDADAEEYLGGIADLTGELVRHAVLRATARDRESVQRIRDLIDGIFGQFLQFDFRNGELRKKYDGMKYALQKAEQLLYDLR